MKINSKTNRLKIVLIFSLLIIPILLIASSNLFIKTLGGAENDLSNAIIETDDGSILVVGSTCSFGNGYSYFNDWWIIKMDDEGNTICEKTFGGLPKDAAYTVSLTSDNGFIVAGFMNFDMVLIKFNQLGDSLWSKTFSGTTVV